MQTDFIFQIIILVMSVVVHEVSHGYVALLLGDKTAEYQGRLTLNPLKHLDWFGSVIFPLLLVITRAGIVFGWAKPVPVNPYNLRNQKWGEAIVSAAGPLSNILIAVVFGLIMRFGFSSGYLPSSFVYISGIIVAINIALAVFNLFPVPPLDGSKIIFALIPFKYHYIRVWLERYQLLLALFFILFLWQYFVPIIPFLFQVITGIGM